MAIRIIECHRVLKNTGSIYLHCDPTMSHHLKIVLDCVVGETNFLNEVVWCYKKWTNAASHFQKNHDILLVYAKENGNHEFNKLWDDTKKDHYERGYHTNTVEKGEK